jgi:hypothetical protein
MTLRQTAVLPTVLLALLAGRPAAAGEAAQPDDFQPLTIDDASPLERGQASAELSTSWDHDRHGDDLIELRPAAKIGAFEGLELELALPYTLGSSDEAGQANFDLGAKYGLRDAGGGLPALALEADVSVPLGSHPGLDTELTLLAAQPLTGKGEGGPALYLNLSWLHFFDAESGEERSNGYAAAFGVSFPVGENTGLVADIVHEDERDRDQATNLVEAGVRREVMEGLILSVGAGTGLAGDSPEFRLTVGLQHQFRAF